MKVILVIFYRILVKKPLNLVVLELKVLVILNLNLERKNSRPIKNERSSNDDDTHESCLLIITVEVVICF